METIDTKPSFFENNAALIKGFFIGFLILVLLIPTLMIDSLVNDRQSRKAEAVKEVSLKWGNAQQLIGPVLRIPYYELEKVEKINASGKKETEQTKEIKYAYFLPDQLIINGDINPEKRSRGIFDVVVYSSKLSFSGAFSNVSFNQFNVASENIIWKEASVLVTINDFRGIEDNIEMIWNGKKMLFNSGASLPFASNSGVEVDKSAIISPVQIEDEGKGDYNFSFGATLKGSESLDFVPIGKITTVQLKSKWPSPSFDGSFLPNTRIISANGFSSSWKILHLNRDFPQQWVKVTPESLNKSVFGVKLITPNDSYQKTSRSIKYAILVISLTFLAFFFVEILNYKGLHLFNYILVGLALCIFYTLLLSISEVLNFNQAYLIASSMTLGLVFFYSKSIFQNVRLAMIVSLVMAILYGFIFIIIQLEDTALLIGSIGLFLILAITMYISRKINWNQIGLEKALV